MKRLIMLAIATIAFTSCSAQEKKKTIPDSRETLEQQDSLHKPKVNVQVNRKYDDNGNLISFDSTYSYFYQSPSGQLSTDNDTIFQKFSQHFNTMYPGFLNKGSKDLFFNDSLFKYDFFNDDYFRKRYELNSKIFEDMFKRMDSIKSEFIEQNYPRGRQRKKDEL